LPACLLINACKVIKTYPLTYTEATEAQKKLPQYYIIDNEHVLTEVWSVTKIDFTKDVINCRVFKVPPPYSEEVVQFTSRNDFNKRKNYIYLFAKPELAQELQKSDSISFDYHKLDHISVLEKDFEKTAARRSPLLSTFYLGVIFIYVVASFFQNL
jgi:hypothetical protein